MGLFKYKILAVIFIIMSLAISAQARIITQITPTVTITEEYNDNYFKKDSDTFEEWITSYELGFTMGFLDRKSQIYLKYNPEYKDYKNLDDRDSFNHNASLSASFQPTKHTTAQADLGYEGHDGNQEGDSWQHSANISINSQLTKFINIYLSEGYTKSYDQQLRTGDYKEHQINTTQVGIENIFGAKNSMGLDFIYEFDEYDNSDADEYNSYEPSAFFNYWFTPLNGMEANLEYEKKNFDASSESDYETIAGDIKYIRKFSRHLDGYLKYRHSLSDKKSGDHQIFHPSAGIDWDVTQDSGISIGVGILFHDWNNENDDSQEIFVDLNAYKIFDFSPRGSLSITGSSSYDEGSEDAGSLGYNISYQAGFSLDYKLTRHLSSNLYGSYEIQDFKEKDENRLDNTGEIGGGLNWIVLKWLQLNIQASHTNFDSDDAQRENYKENKITFMVQLIPEKPIRPDKLRSRKSLENQVFGK